MIQGLQNDVEKGLAVFNHGRDRIAGIFKRPTFQAEVGRDLGQDLIGSFSCEDIGFLVLLQIPGLVVGCDLDPVCFLLADFHDVAVKNAGFPVL